MKATEFVKKYGFDGAYELWQGSFHLFENDLCILIGYVCRLSDSEPLFSLCELKRLIESHELVESGLPELKKSMFSNSKDLEYVKNWLLRVSDKLLTEKGVKLKQAVLDVESCK